LLSSGYLTVDDAGNIWVADYGNHRIQQFAPDGRFLRAWGRYGADEGQLSSPLDVAVAADGAVYVADNGNHRIQVFDPEGRFLGQWGSAGAGEGQFIGPSGLALDRAGNIYVVDNNRAQKFHLIATLTSAATPTS
jgi:DNA-binding beta-propeller fold protein YncE